MGSSHLSTAPCLNLKENKMDWKIWNERQRVKEKLKKGYKRFMTDSYGSVMFKYKDRRKNG
jgi:hypothetical protein